MKRILPGIYEDETGMHIDVVELLRDAGFANTPANVDRVIEAARNVCREMGIHVEVADEPIEP